MVPVLMCRAVNTEHTDACINNIMPEQVCSQDCGDGHAVCSSGSQNLYRLNRVDNSAHAAGHSNHCKTIYVILKKRGSASRRHEQ